MQASLERFGVILRQRMADLHVCEAQQNKVSPLVFHKRHTLSVFSPIQAWHVVPDEVIQI